MFNNISVFPRLVCLLSIVFCGQFCFAERDEIEQTFFPDIQEATDLTVPPVGTSIDASNVAEFNAVLDPALVDLIRSNKFSIKVGESTHFPVHSNYIAATRKFAVDVSLGNKPGVIKNYIAGRPFPVLDINDSRAGEKAAWNMRYAYAPDETEVTEFFWQYRDMRSGKIERNLAMRASTMRFKHRHTIEPVPELLGNSAGIFNALYLYIEKPLDIRGTQLLIHRLEDDTRQEQVWLYPATQRRVRRLAAGQTTDAFLGSDIMIEDFLGFNGRIIDMEWHYRGSKWMLMPLYQHNDLYPAGDNNGSFTPVAYTGQGNCFPDVTWQLRKVHLLDAIPLDPEHPLSRRSFYIDAQGFGPPLIKIYDRAKRLWKLGIIGVSDSRHYPDSAGWHGGIFETVSMIDLQAEHCTTIQLRPRIPKEPLSPNQFSVQQLRSKGR